MTQKLLPFILCLTGLALVIVGLNTALGGMTTLGWQFPPDMMTVTNPENFARHDSNARFFAGVFTGLGLTMAASAAIPTLRRVTAIFLIGIALGGLLRLLQPGYSPLTDMQLLPSIFAELVLAPALAFWIIRSGNA